MRFLERQVWVYGNSFENVLVAVVVPSEAAFTAWAERENGASAAGDFAALCRSGAAPRACGAHRHGQGGQPQGAQSSSDYCCAHLIPLTESVWGCGCVL